MAIDPSKPAYGTPDNPAVQHLYLDKLISEVKERRFKTSDGEEQYFDHREAERLVFTRWRHSYLNAFEGDTEGALTKNLPLVHDK